MRKRVRELNCGCCRQPILKSGRPQQTVECVSCGRTVLKCCQMTFTDNENPCCQDKAAREQPNTAKIRKEVVPAAKDQQPPEDDFNESYTQKQKKIKIVNRQADEILTLALTLTLTLRRSSRGSSPTRPPPSGWTPPSAY